MFKNDCVDRWKCGQVNIEDFMKRNYRNLIIYLIIYLFVTISLFGGGYYFLVKNFISDKTTDNLSYLVEATAVNLDNKISNDVEKYLEILNSYDMTINKEEVIAQLELNDNIKKIFNTNINFGYFKDNKIIINHM